MHDKYMSKLSPTVDFWAGMYLVIIAVLSVLGNAAVLVSTARRLAFLKAPELLTVNLAVTDIGMALSMYPLSIASAFNHAWIGGDVSCLYYGLMGMIFSITSIMTLAVMGTVRYLVTGSPPKTGIKFQRRTISIVISGIWLYAGLWALFPLLGWGSYGPEPFGLACSIDWTGYGQSVNHSTFIMTLSILCTFLPCLVVFFTYFGIAWKLHRAYQSIQSKDFQCGNVEKKITLMAVLISLGFFIAWTPYVAVSFWSMFHPQEQDHMTPFITLLPCLFAKSSTVYNPFIYFIFQRTLWHELPQIQRLLFCCSHQVSSPAKEAKLEGKRVKDETCVGLMGISGKQSGSEIISLG
ncbi:opsin 8, group member a [Anabas testudineus]|uniref:G-protein coupled receptors family 1 profile domain-containing protein n=1 Tax=Anabas testudineus TaxID=64144 RepID=A0A3Q1J064_ANATE|nr:opsin 8, group member a [Anabas testudineus]